jgi:hypothetical protein
MKRRLLQALGAGALAVVLLGAAPQAVPAIPVALVDEADAAVTKSLSGGGGGGNVSGAGNRFGDLLSGWAVPVLTVIAGCLLIGTLASRNIGASVGIVVITLLGLIFLLSPQSIEALAKGIAKVVF